MTKDGESVRYAYPNQAQSIMRFFSPSLLLFTALAAASAPQQSGAQSFIYAFEAAQAAGVAGFVEVTYTGGSGSEARVNVELDFSRVNATALEQFDANCKQPVTQFQYHIHTNWKSERNSNAYAMCARSETANHYDPLYACGPASQFVDAPECAGKVQHYACTPERYAQDPLACEKGDLSGKAGTLKLDPQTKRAKAQWTDPHYPLVSENSNTWNIVLHAVCENKANPRVACAVGLVDDDYWEIAKEELLRD